MQNVQFFLINFPFLSNMCIYTFLQNVSCNLTINSFNFRFLSFQITLSMHSLCVVCACVCSCDTLAS
uniref:Uncharacterized protein n=1 Tax=Ciona intestinalis TaxID=7719 RepID=H2Y2I1_CIOIN